MESVPFEAIENSIQPAAIMRQLTEPLGLTDVAVNYYELEPGDSFAFAYHNHEIQEEIFYVHTGTATFETEAGAIDIGPKAAIRFEPGEFQRGWNRGNDRVSAIAIGAPLDYGDQTKLRYCSHCETETDSSLERREEDAVVVATCVNCGAETGRWSRGSMDGTVP